MDGSVVPQLLDGLPDSGDSGAGIPSQTLSIYLFKEDTTWDEL